MKTKSSENRQDLRKTCVVPVESKAGTAFENVQTLDISRSGIGFVSSQPIPLNEQIAIEIELDPDEDPLLVIGQVQWVRKISNSEHYRIGMKFSSVLHPENQARLSEYFPERLK